ncbi:hypothetical protein N7540_004771 [Penicillium herquei]|nr:hypothetical protein N7540_004771 [Penicillium herquei]
MDGSTNEHWNKMSRMVMTIGAIGLITFCYKLVQARLVFYRLRKKGLPTPPWNPILGNLVAIGALKQKGPSDLREADLFAYYAAETKGLEAGFYVDVWPFAKEPMLCVTSPPMAIEACQTHDLPKPKALQAFINPMAGGSDNMFVTNGAVWKHSRDLFSHGFSMSASLGHMKCILEEAKTYVQILRDHAQRADVFLLDPLTCAYGMDIIGNITLNTRFRFQENQRNPIAATMRDIIEQQLGFETGSLSYLSPYRFYKNWQNSRTINYYIGVELEKSFQEWKHSHQLNQSTSHPKSIINIILTEYMKTQPNAQEQTHLNPEFKKWATIQTRLFLFVGHDSEASTIIYSIYLLSKNPDILTKVRAEHDAIFGPGSNAYDVLLEHPEKINQLPYTHAIIKETLRLYPPANGLRGGQAGVSLHDEHGRAFPTEGVNIWIIHTAVHRNPAFWPKPHEFIPDRWLVEKDHPLYPPAGGWRPFEHGARQCIGQNISLMGVKASLAMVLREFDFHDAYAEYDALNASSGLKTMFDDRVYMIQKGSGHPAQGFPCKVTLRDKS